MPELHSHLPEHILKTRSRKARAVYIAGLDAERDCQEISYLLACYEFPWDTTRSLELALFRVFGIAKGSPLLVQTGEFLQRTQKRYDDTVLILSEIMENGYDSPRGRAALRRMNEQHGRYRIPNDEYLYTLSTFIYEPIRWNARFGWRRLTKQEKESSYYLWREIGRRMAIKDIPESYEAFERFNIAFEREHFQYSAYNKALAEATRNLMLSWVLPKWLWPLGAPFIHALIDEPMLRAVGFPLPPVWLRRLVEGLLRTRAWAQRLLPPRRHARLLTRTKNRTYSKGYEVGQLGADR
ncbi:MAG: DUF2236 domain-containing protein [Lewinellaceae bacterium]|nr:DUF2236 domain-containing protein [Lewinellaceae bacterium]